MCKCISYFPLKCMQGLTWDASLPATVPAAEAPSVVELLPPPRMLSSLLVRPALSSPLLRRACSPAMAAPLYARFDAIVFDKDGTLLDFSATWDPAIYEAIRSAAPEDEAKQAKIADLLGFDLQARTCLTDAPVVHQSNTELVELVSPLTDGRALLDRGAQLVNEHVTAVPDADDVLRALREAGIPTCVATNDEEASTRAQLDALGWLAGGSESPLLSAVFACDSGHGSKPEPGMLLAAATATGVAPERCAMVGDAAGDLVAAKRAGFAAAILVGPEEAVGQHAHLADFWVRDLGGLLRPSAEAAA